jgi:ubiquinone/menaquinone biosynthesis C-methylase UbiE
MSHDHSHGHSHSHDHDHPWSPEDAAWYIANWGEHPTNKMTAAMAELERGDVVLDIGCGTGAALRAAAATVSRGRLIGVDPTAEMIAAAREKADQSPDPERFEFHRAGASALPLPDDTASVVWAINSLHFWPDVALGLSEVRRALKPGGRLLVTAEEVDGRFGHGEGELNQTAAVEAALKAAGFRGVETSRHVDGETRMLLIRARNPWS